MQKVMIALGLLIIIAGIFWSELSKLPIGRLPGDLYISKENFKLYFPITTMIIVSIVCSLLVWLFRK